MKKQNYLIVLLFIAALALPGCKKCAECTTTVTQTATGQQPVVATSTAELCGDDLKQADGNVTNATSTVMGFTANVRSETKCR